MSKVLASHGLLIRALERIATMETAPEGLSNSAIFQMVLTSQRKGLTCLPYRLGMEASDYLAFYSHYRTQFSILSDREIAKDDLRQTLMEMRIDEYRDIRELLIANRRSRGTSELWMASIVAAGCLGGDHLWRDMGLVNRKVLSDLLVANFPNLAQRNSQDMKWKKFFYKQLCEQQGSYVCRAPSCGHCAAYSDCFGPEE